MTRRAIDIVVSVLLLLLSLPVLLLAMLAIATLVAMTMFRPKEETR